MHLTLKKETTKPAANNFLRQQEKLDRFLECCNHERPHQAIEMRYPVELYRASARPYHGLDPLKVLPMSAE
jgi:putative transposase